MLRNIHLGSGLVSLAASLALCVACGGGSDGGNAGAAGSGSGGSGSSATFSSSLPANEQLSSISDQDSATLCKEIDTFESGTNNAKLLDFSCRVTGLLGAAFSGASTDAGLQAACKTAYDACTAAPTTTTTTCTKPDATCTATVAELEACLNDSGPYVDQALNQVPSCATLTQASLSSDTSTSTPMSPASCTTFETKCPDSNVPLPSGM